jgi:hypothetical protein
MRLYTRTGATALDHPDYGHFDADDNGGFDFPDDVSEQLHRFHVGGRPAWESDIERQARLLDEERQRRQDPETLLAAVEQIMRAAQATQPAAEPAPAAKSTRGRKAATSE